MNFLREQDKCSEEFENGCIPMHCGARVVSGVLVILGGLIVCSGRLFPMGIRFHLFCPASNGTSPL